MTSKPGALLRSVTVQPHTNATGRLEKGQLLRIIDVEGQQIADFVSLKLDDPTECLDLRAEMDLWWAVSVCIWPGLCGPRPTPLRFDTYDGNA